MSSWHFPSTALLLQLRGRKDCRRLTPPSATEAIVSKPQSLFSSPHFQALWRRQHREAKGKMADKMHMSICDYSDLNFAIIWCSAWPTELINMDKCALGRSAFSWKQGKEKAPHSENLMVEIGRCWLLTLGSLRLTETAKTAHISFEK